MTLRKMSFEVLIIGVVHVLVMRRAQMARQMLLVQMIEEDEIIEEELITEVAERMRQDLAMMVISHVALLEMIAQRLDVVKALFANEHCATSQANLTEGLLMLSFEMALQRRLVGELRAATITAGNHAVQSAQCKTGFLGLGRMVIDRVILRVHVALLQESLGCELPIQVSIGCDDDFVQVRSANGALLILHDESRPQGAYVTNLVVVTWTKSKVVQLRAA